MTTGRINQVAALDPDLQRKAIKQFPTDPPHAPKRGVVNHIGAIKRKHSEPTGTIASQGVQAPDVALATRPS